MSDQAELFDEQTEPPPPGVLVSAPDADEVYRCPYCGDVSLLDDCDSMGADQDCVFCPACSMEFKL